MKRTFAFILAIIFTALPLASCKGGGTGSGQLLSFSQAQSIEEMEKLDGKENISFMFTTNNKRHNPNYTEDASKYLMEYVQERSRLVSQKKLTTPEQKAAFLARYDWDRMTAQDERVWQKIFEHLDDTK